MSEINIAIVVGTRPELINLADMIRSLRANKQCHASVIFTGQHEELVQAAAGAFKIQPDYHLEPCPPGRTLTDLFSSVIKGLGDLLRTIPTAGLIVQGDTISALAGAMTSEMMAIPLIHVEAGVRSKSRNDPFPEETIRRIISPISELHICFSEATRGNLLREGIDPRVIRITPHPLQDRVRPAVATACALDAIPSVLVTLHRRERRLQRIRSLITAVDSLRRDVPNVQVEFIWHPALTFEDADLRAEISNGGITIIPPLAPQQFLEKLALSRLVITDSAGVAEEAQFLGKPLIAFRLSAETRIDGRAVAPICVTETATTAANFAARWINAQPLVTESPIDLKQSAGAVIANEIVQFLETFNGT